MAGGTNTPLLGYPTPIGNKILSIFDRTGPKSYANIGTSSGKGDVIQATELGYGGFDSLSPRFGAYSASGNFFVKVFTGSATTVPSVTLGPGNSFPSMALQWFTTSAAFGTVSTEVTNTTDLSAETIRLEAILV